MPVYEFECRNDECDFTSEEVRWSFAKYDELKEKFCCEVCKKQMLPKIFANNFQLKGGGWFDEGYVKGNNNTT